MCASIAFAAWAADGMCALANNVDLITFACVVFPLTRPLPHFGKAPTHASVSLVKTATRPICATGTHTLDPVCCFYLGANCGGGFSRPNAARTSPCAYIRVYTCVYCINIDSVFMNGERLCNVVCVCECVFDECVDVCNIPQTPGCGFVCVVGRVFLAFCQYYFCMPNGCFGGDICVRNRHIQMIRRV